MSEPRRRRARPGVGWIFAAGVFAIQSVHAAQEADELEVRLPGMEVQRIDEPVFNGRVAVYEAGKDNARGILLVHGIGSEGVRDFRDQIDWLQKSYHVVAVDLPGFGQSDKANALYSPGNYALVLKHVASRFLGRPFSLVGHSMGAVVSLRYAAAYPEDVARLVVVDAPGVLHRHSFASQYLAHLGLEFVPSTIDPVGGLARLARRLLAPLERLSVDPEIVLSSPELRERLLSADPAKIAGLAVVSEDLRKVLPKVAAETLVVWGAKDTIAPLRAGRVLVLKLPRARLTVIERAGHEPMLEAPLRFRAAVEPFLGRGFPPAPASAEIPLPQRGDASCHGKRGALFEGEYGELTLEKCQEARIRNARVRELRVLDSSVTIDDSRIGGGEIGLYARGATITMTGGRIEGDTAISALSSRLDLAAVEVEGREAAVASQKRSYVVFSLSRLKSPHTKGEVHGFYAVTGKNPL
jgi:pimeloyl-ACP methyl ester carboxylesterase